MRNCIVYLYCIHSSSVRKQLLIQMPLPCNPTYIYGSVVGGIPRWIGVSVKIALKIYFHWGLQLKMIFYSVVILTYNQRRHLGSKSNGSETKTKVLKTSGFINVFIWNFISTEGLTKKAKGKVYFWLITFSAKGHYQDLTLE